MVACWTAHAQTGTEPYSRGNTFAFFAGVGFPDSGVYTESPGRTLLGFGARYEHRFWNSKRVEFHYLAEFRPVVLVRNVTATFTETYITPTGIPPISFSGVQASCAPGGSTQVSQDPTGKTYVIQEMVTCGHEWDVAEAFAPAGFVWKFRRGHRLQPVAGWTGGVLFATKAIPDSRAGSFNFTYQFGGGVEYYLRPKRSVEVRYDFHHFSNAGTADYNPGVNNGVVQVSYSFGR